MGYARHGCRAKSTGMYSRRPHRLPGYRMRLDADRTQSHWDVTYIYRYQKTKNPATAK